MNIKIEAKSNVWKVKANIKKTWKNSSNLIQKLPHLSNLPIALTRVSHSLLYMSSNLIHFFQYQFCLYLNFWFLKDFFVLVYLFYLFILVGDFVVVFVIYWYESTMGLHVFSILNKLNFSICNIITSGMFCDVIIRHEDFLPYNIQCLIYTIYCWMLSDKMEEFLKVIFRAYKVKR